MAGEVAVPYCANVCSQLYALCWLVLCGPCFLVTKRLLLNSLICIIHVKHLHLHIDGYLQFSLAGLGNGAFMT